MLRVSLPSGSQLTRITGTGCDIIKRLYCGYECLEEVTSQVGVPCRLAEKKIATLR